MSIAKFLRNFRHTSSPSRTSFYQSIYPESVRYALAYDGAQMRKPEMIALLNNYVFEAVYLVTKALGDDREAQRQFLEHLTCLYAKPTWQVADLQHLLRTTIEALPDDVSITGTKLAQLSRLGAENWQTAFKEIAQQLLEDEPAALPIIIAHTPIIAYHQFIEAYRERRNSKLFILVPELLMAEDESLMGYEITLSDTPTVQFQVKDECLFGSWACLKTECILQQHFCRKAIFIDDTINTATTIGKMRSFWHTEYGVNLPDDRIRCITDMRLHKAH